MNAVRIAAVLTFALAVPAHGQDAAALMQSSGCTECHAMKANGIAPGWTQIAAKYAGKSGAAASVVAVIKNGGHGGGPISMPAASGMSDANAKKIADYILSRK